MNYKKIILTPKNGLITPLESDTVLSYVFAYNFDKLQNIFEKFKNRNPSFVISNGFINGSLPKPFYFNENFKNDKKTTLTEDLDKELERKKLKNLSTFPIDKELFELFFEGEDKEKYDKKIENYLNNLEKNNIKTATVSDFKNSIPRFNIGETNPYEVENIKYIDGKYVIYAKINDENDFDNFFECLKNTFENIGFGKAKSRGYGHFEKVELFDLEENEKELFDYFEELKNKNLYFVLNNYKPTDEEIENMDLQKSYYQINSKHTKSLYEFNKEIFKGQMNFFKEGSVIYSEKKLNGDFYKSGDSYNFGFIF